MKRFVTYLYECESGSKSKNVGFIRVNVRGDEVTMEVYIQNYLRSDDKGEIYALINKQNLFGIELGEIKITNGKGDSRISFQTDDIEGIGIRLESGAYIASCWKDEYAERIVRGEFQIEEELEVQLAVAEEPQIQESQLQAPNVTYQKIDLNQIRKLPSPNWHFITNSFLLHGFTNYGYLVLKKEMEKDKEKLALGVPGIFEKPEAVMAVLFGFPTFEEVPSEMVEIEMNAESSFSNKEKNQEAAVGTFGCWFVELNN